MLVMVLLGMVLARVVTPMRSWSQSSSVSAVSNSDQTRKGKVFCVWLFYFFWMYAFKLYFPGMSEKNNTDSYLT